MLRVSSACKKPKSCAYSGRKATSACPLLLASKALWTASFVGRPLTWAKSPQWLVRVHFARTEAPGFSIIDALVIIPLNIRTGVLSSMAPVSGSKNALYTNTSLFA